MLNACKLCTNTKLDIKFCEKQLTVHLPSSFSMCYNNIFQFVRHSGVRTFNHLNFCLEKFLIFNCKMLLMEDNLRVPTCSYKCTPLSETCSYNSTRKSTTETGYRAIRLRDRKEYNKESSRPELA